jgi:selenocysteine lyase/cysteine desulfurase
MKELIREDKDQPLSQKLSFIYDSIKLEDANYREALSVVADSIIHDYEFRFPDDLHPHDIAEVLNRHHVAVRAGHHCTMPLMDYLELGGTTRVSFGVYNTTEDIDTLIIGIKEVKKIFC